MSHITYLEASVVGLIQGITELFPVSSLGHNVLIPALIGGSWATDLNVAAPESPYLAFIVGLHVATAIALLIYFWRDWVRIIGGFFSSHPRPPGIETADQKLAWMIILATIPVGLVGLVFEHEFRVLFGKPIRAAIFLDHQRRDPVRRASSSAPKSLAADAEIADGAEDAWPSGGRPAGRRRHARLGPARGAAAEIASAVQSRPAAAAVGYLQALVIGSSQILALLAGISRDGVTMVAGMFRGLSREDAARFSFLLATPVILAAGVLKVPDLIGPLGQRDPRPGARRAASLSGVGAYLSVRFLMKYFQTRTLTPFAVYCVVVGLGSIIYLGQVVTPE